MRHKQSQGEYIGGQAPYGFELVNGELVADDYEQAVTQQARELRESGLEKLGRHFRERREARERGDVIDVESARMLDERSDDE